MRNIRVTVQRDELITAIERKANQCKKDWEKAVAKHQVEWEKWQADTVKYLRARADQIEKLTYENREKPRKNLDSRNEYGLRNEPRLPFEPQGYSHILRLLRLSKKPTVSVTEEQFRAYMDGCAIR